MGRKTKEAEHLTTKGKQARLEFTFYTGEEVTNRQYAGYLCGKPVGCGRCLFCHECLPLVAEMVCISCSKDCLCGV